MAQTYELMVVYRPTVTEDDVPQKVEGLRSLVMETGATVTEVTDWGRRRLGYPIKTHFEGHYVITHFAVDSGDRNIEIEQALNIDESILRHLLVRAET